ncbi:GGDEF domain-containing protein [Acinetobacter wanghuae]|nr:GGDEF domain-containing protein [Acinetobacter wanghuae]
MIQKLSQYRYSLSFIVIFFTILAAAWFGIFTRPLSYSAFFWPANAILLGVLIRYPFFRNISSIIGAALGYIGADLFIGNTFLLTLSLTVINFISVLVALYFYLYFYKNQTFVNNKKFMRNSFPLLFSTIIGSCFCACLAVSVLPYVPHTFLGHEQPLLNFLYWWSGELFNYILILPILISFPGLRKLARMWFYHPEAFKWSDLKIILPFIAVMISCVLTHYYFAPGALFYPLATLMWAAAVYSLFSISIITMLTCLTLYNSLSSMYLSSVDHTFIYPMISIRVGLIILGITTLYICVMNLYHRKIFREIEHLAGHDSLTNALNRRKFMYLASKLLSRQQVYPVTIMMLDIDHFKTLNDRYGHASGDLALQTFSSGVHALLRANDLFCRIGGEEFAIFLQNTDASQGEKIAERIRQQISDLKVETPAYGMIQMTVSIGLVNVSQNKYELQALLQYADQALYWAKQQGRNQVKVYQSLDAPQPKIESIEILE